MADTKKQVLIIEQNSSLKTYYTSMLQKIGLDPKLVVSGADALKFLKGNIDGTLFLIVMDWNLPDMNGYILAQKVRSEPKLSGVEFLICASELAVEDTLLMQELDVTHVLPKGASTQQIIEKVKTIQNDAGRAPRAMKLRRELETKLRNGQIQEATALLDEPELKKEFAASPAHVHLLGEFEILRKKYDETLSLLEKHVEEIDMSAMRRSVSGGANALKCANTYAKALSHLGRFAEAETLFAKLAEKSPKNLFHIVSQADALLGQDRIDEAEMKYAAAIAQDASNRDALIGMGKAAVVKGELDKANEYFNQVDGGVDSPQFASFFNNRAVALIHAGKVEEAIRLYEDALKFIKRDRFLVMFNLGMAHLRLKNAAKAADLFQQVLDTCRTEFVARKSILQKFKSVGRVKFIELYGQSGDATHSDDDKQH